MTRADQLVLQSKAGSESCTKTVFLIDQYLNNPDPDKIAQLFTTA